MSHYLSKNESIVAGLDVHKDTITACVFNRDTGEILLEKTIKNQPISIRKMVRRIEEKYGTPHCCYEASSCGFVLYRLLKELDIPCHVIAPSSIPKRAGSRVKTDRIDAKKLATLFASGLLEAVHVPDEDVEQTRSLLRCRAASVEELTRAKHRTTQFLLTRGLVYREGTNWSRNFWVWLRQIELQPIDNCILNTYVHLVHYLEGQIQALEDRIGEAAERPPFQLAVQTFRAFRGIDTVTALTLAAEIGDLRRFSHPRQLMGYFGLVPSEHSSGSKTHRGSITKTGNAHARKAIVTAAWKYTAAPTRSRPLKERQRNVSPAVVAISWKAQKRLYKRFQALTVRKPRSVAVVAIARELVGFLWDARQTAEAHSSLKQAA